MVIEVAGRGPLSVTMAQIAEAPGTGRATSNLHLPDVEVLAAGHERHVAASRALRRAPQAAR